MELQNTKYYTPDITEFYTMFEYEVSNDKGITWIEEEFHLNDSHIDLIKYVKIQDDGKNSYLIRVKYLDKEDIESLGWRLSPRETHYSIEIPGDGSDTQMYYQEDNYYTMIYDWDGQSIFKGYIKNKSELIKLMKQLGIWKN